MQFLSVSHRRTERYADTDFAAYAEEEAAHARALYRDGFIRQIWHRADVPGACMVVEAESEEEVRAKLSDLPLMRAGMLDVVIIPLEPYAGFCSGRVGQAAKEDHIHLPTTKG
ncbi:MAG: muconolactone Delta-isomerase family protein [Vicinamibacteraceae bacterium]